MCGICGSTAASRDLLESMKAVLLHRGPDDEGTYLDPLSGVGLGARRLKIIDLERGHQPLANEDGTVWAALNGEIYNYRPLREELLRRGHTLATECDTEVIVHLYEDHGPELVDLLEGMFALAIWDTRRKRLLLARDRFGEKPLFYVERDGDITFASELTALVQTVPGSAQLDPAAINAYFVLGYVPDDVSLIAGARQLLPAHLLQWNASDRSTSIVPYWEPPANVAQTVPRGDLVGEVEKHLDASVQARLIADVPLGVFLSGGVDSSLVAALAARHVPQLRTFSVGYDVGTVNETARAAEVAALVGAEHHELVLTHSQIQTDVPRMLAQLDQPIADEALVALRALAYHARHVVTVAVGGEGADELFGGYPRYRWLERGARLPSWACGRLTEQVTSHIGARSSSRTGRLAYVFGRRPLFERNLGWMTDERAASRAGLYGRRLHEWCRETPGAIPARAAQLASDGHVAGALMHLDQIRWLPGDVLAKADRATMHASLEMRTPFLDRSVAQFAATIPAEFHTRGGGKLLLRQLLRRVLPGLHVGSSKTAFRTPTAQWLRGPLSGHLQEHLASSRIYDEGWFDRDAVMRLAREHAAQERDRSGLLWPTFVLGSWLDAHSEVGC